MLHCNVSVSVVGLLRVVAAPLIKSAISVYWNTKNSGVIINNSPKLHYAIVLLSSWRPTSVLDLEREDIYGENRERYVCIKHRIRVELWQSSSQVLKYTNQPDQKHITEKQSRFMFCIVLFIEQKFTFLDKEIIIWLRSLNSLLVFLFWSYLHQIQLPFIQEHNSGWCKSDNFTAAPMVIK